MNMPPEHQWDPTPIWLRPFFVTRAAAARCEIVDPDITIARDQHPAAVGGQPRVLERTGGHGTDRPSGRPVAVHPAELPARGCVGKVDERPVSDRVVGQPVVRVRPDEILAAYQPWRPVPSRLYDLTVSV